MNMATEMQNSLPDPHLTAVEAVLSQLFDNRNEKGGADDDHIEQVPQLSPEHDEAEAVDLEQDLHDEDGKEAEFETVQVEQDEDSIEDDNGVEKVAKCPMFDDGFEPGGCGRGVELWHAKLEYVRLDFDYSNVEEIGRFQKLLLSTDLRRRSIVVSLNKKIFRYLAFGFSNIRFESRSLDRHSETLQNLEQ
jgi:hypothetical protein